MIIRDFSSSFKTDLFSCGKPDLDIYLKRQASQDKRRGYAAVFAALDTSNNVTGFYTLSAASVNLSRFPAEEARKLPRYPEVPAIRLGRLAVDLLCQKHHIGRYLLLDALKRSCASEIAWAIFLVDAKDEQIQSFYKKFYFMSFMDNQMSMWLKRKQAEYLISIMNKIK